MLVRSEEWDGRSDMRFSTPLTKSIRGMQRWNRWCISCSHKKCAGEDMQVVEPLRYHQSPAVLSVRENVVRSVTTKYCATQSLCTTPPASSNSELLTVPCGFVQLTRESTISLGKGIYRTMGCAPLEFGEGCAALGCGSNFRGMDGGPGSTTLSHMYLDASW